MLELENLTVVETKWLHSCTLNQQQVAERLDISERYLRELEAYWPPRTKRGRGFESEYPWPATLFWFLEFQVAKVGRENDMWGFQIWVDRNYCLRCLRMAEEKIEKLVRDLRAAGVSRPLIKAATQILEQTEQLG